MTEEKSYQDINAETIDRWVESGWEWGIPVTHEVCEKARQGEWDVYLTPTKPVPHDWFGDLRGKKLFGLASGGGQQMPVFACLGALCTVMDYSVKQLESEHTVADREGYAIEILRGDMTNPFPFADEIFDILFHPVSNCYIKEVQHVWNECYRVLKPGGILLAGLDMGWNFAIDEEAGGKLCHLPFDPLTDPLQRRELEATDSGMQFSHTLTEQIGGQLKAGFCLTDLFEDTNGSGLLHEYGIPSFAATRAVKPHGSKGE